MKKLLNIVMCVLLICVLSVPVSAEEAKYATAGDLYEAWSESLPDYICGIWSTDGGTENLTFGIQDNEAGNAGKRQMLELIENDGSVTFVYQQFSRNYLLQIQEEIFCYFEKDLGLVSTGLDEYDNCIQLGILKERKGDADTQAMIRELTGKYGKAVSVVYTGAISPTVLGEQQASLMQPVLLSALVLTVLAGGFLLLLGQAKRRVLLQTGKGTGAATATPLTDRDVETMIKNAPEPVPPALEQKILDAIGR